jgi:hypothetical protein
MIVTTGLSPEIALAGDLDGDGYGDVAVGDDYDSTVSKHSGAVWLYSGASLLGGTGHFLPGDADAVYFGTGWLSHAGSSLAACGDLDADGRDELLVGAEGSGGGDVYLLSAPLIGSGSLEHADVRFSSHFGGRVGYDVAGVGDVDADGIPDFVVGNPGWGGGTYYDYGAAHLVSGADL